MSEKTSKRLRRTSGERRVPRKTAEVLEYLRFKGMLTVPAFVDVINAAGIDMEPHDGQWQIIDAYEERIDPTPKVLEMAELNGLDINFEYRYKVLIAACGRRFGKSVVAGLIGAQEMLVPHAKVLIVSKTLENCEIIFDIICNTLRTILGEEEFAEYRKNKQELVLKNGALLRVASKENVESKLGSALSLLILDEAKLYSRKLFEQVLSPMLLDYAPYARTILISSPEAGWFETYYNFGQSPLKPRHWSINLPTHANPTVDLEELEEFKRNNSPDVWEQEILGKFTSNAGLVCREFTKEGHVYHDEDYPEFTQWLQDGNPIINMVDSGYDHYFASLWVMFVEEIDTYFVFHEYQMNKKTTSTHAANIHAFEEEHHLDISIRYADPGSAQQNADFVEYDLYFTKAAKELRETINNLNALFFQRSKVTGTPRLLVNSECHELIRQLTSVQWKEGREDGQSKEQSALGTKPFKPDLDGPGGGGKRTDWDMFDAFRYGMFTYNRDAMGASISFLSIDSSLATEDEEDDEYLRMSGLVRC